MSVSEIAPVKDLTPQQRAAIDQLARGETVSAVARFVAVSRQTVSGWLNHDPQFQAALNAKRRLIKKLSTPPKLPEIRDIPKRGGERFYNEYQAAVSAIRDAHQSALSALEPVAVGADRALMIDRRRLAAEADRLARMAELAYWRAYLSADESPLHYNNYPPLQELRQQLEGLEKQRTEAQRAYREAIEITNNGADVRAKLRDVQARRLAGQATDEDVAAAQADYDRWQAADAAHARAHLDAVNRAIEIVRKNYHPLVIEAIRHTFQTAEPTYRDAVARMVAAVEAVQEVNDIVRAIFMTVARSVPNIADLYGTFAQEFPDLWLSGLGEWLDSAREYLEQPDVSSVKEGDQR